MEPFILSPVPYAQLLEDMRAIIRHETAQQPASASPAEPNAGSDLLTVQEAADMLDVCPQTIHEWKRRGVLTYHKMGRRTYLKQAEVLAALQSEKRTVKSGKKSR
ncbi:helix-turn-helix domain-containing protein [Hymenobacter sp. BT770]|uniref:helix-turn-helix domain-containing protein n=1 Tax=Hymenobacter sp. BT770 TaxID=2886942 RepID=UPI001D10342B|nr:helix-turn-helix domain-containing protein [Hymenobacter sp. BT770]MCC3152768.1 helix-turn-helix domain-containing protein [Hymenobacter sp. BT770]MDO3414843.1 helix-turn-helix domain-containing protein [Hymenobacter sp. BT770]